MQRALRADEARDERIGRAPDEIVHRPDLNDGAFSQQDEPLGALDPLTRADLQADLRQAFADLGKTVVIVTHDLAEAAWFARRIALLRDGRIVQEGTLDALARHPADPFVARFVRAQRSVVLPPAEEP